MEKVPFEALPHENQDWFHHRAPNRLSSAKQEVWGNERKGSHIFQKKL